MFDIGASEFLLVAIIAIVVIGPKDMPLALRAAGRWIAKIRRVSGHFRSGIESMIREAELEEMERKWREQNETIMKEHPPAPEESAGDSGAPVPGSAESALPPPASKGEALARDAAQEKRAEMTSSEPQLPLPPP